jgi:hypothetical protein
MNKPQAFKDWCKAHGIATRSHDESVAWAAWVASYTNVINKIKENINGGQATSKSDK